MIKLTQIIPGIIKIKYVLPRLFCFYTIQIEFKKRKTFSVTLSYIHCLITPEHGSYINQNIFTGKENSVLAFGQNKKFSAKYFFYYSP